MSKLRLGPLAIEYCETKQKYTQFENHRSVDVPFFIAFTFTIQLESIHLFATNRS